MQEHWLAVRKVEGAWYNFNSLFPAPQVRTALEAALEFHTALLSVELPDVT